MTREPYSPCPCGSGKKLKFCCSAIVTDIERIQKLRSSNQPKLALQSLSELRRSHPDNAWIITTETSIHLAEGNHEEAYQLISEFAESQTDNSLAQALYAMSSMLTVGLTKSRRIIHRAFQRSSGPHPDLMCNIAVGIASIMHANDLYMSCRQHLALAMKLAAEQDRQTVFMRLLELESSSEIAFPFRSVHRLIPVSGLDDEDARNSARAQRLTEIGCFGPAAKLYSKLLESHPDQGALTYNLGLAEAWDGNESAAAGAFHRAAGLLDDFEQAVEAETLAQLLEHSTGDLVEYYGTEILQVNSVSASIGLLDENPRILRSEVEEAGQESSGVVARYRLIDRAMLETDPSDWTWTDVPSEIGTLLLVDADAVNELPGRVILSALQGTELEQCTELVNGVLGDQIQSSETVPEEELTYCIARDFLHLPYREFDPETARGKDRIRLREERWQHAIHESWPATKLVSLGGKSPREVAEAADSKVALRAAIHVLESFCNQSVYSLDVTAVCDQLNIDHPATIPVSPELPLASLSAMQLNRITVADLSDQQLAYTLNRALLLRHPVFLDKVLREVIHRPGVLQEVDSTRVFDTLIELSVGRGQTEDALNWIAQAQALPVADAQRFEMSLKWKLRELSVRLFDPTDPELKGLVDELWNNFGRKIPELQNDLRQVLERYGMSIPESSLVTGISPTDTPQGGVWTPGQSEPESDAPGKIWLPGS